MIHKATVMPRFSTLFGHTHQPVCVCTFTGGHYRNPDRALEASREHERRHNPRRVKKATTGGSVVLW